MSTNSVTYGRTVSKNFQSERAEITFEINEGDTVQYTLELAKEIVDEFLNLTGNNAKHLGGPK